MPPSGDSDEISEGEPGCHHPGNGDRHLEHILKILRQHLFHRQLTPERHRIT